MKAGALGFMIDLLFTGGWSALTARSGRCTVHTSKPETRQVVPRHASYACGRLSDRIFAWPIRAVCIYVCSEGSRGRSTTSNRLWMIRQATIIHLGTGINRPTALGREEWRHWFMGWWIFPAGDAKYRSSLAHINRERKQVPSFMWKHRPDAVAAPGVYWIATYPRSALCIQAFAIFIYEAAITTFNLFLFKHRLIILKVMLLQWSTPRKW